MDPNDLCFILRLKCINLACDLAKDPKYSYSRLITTQIHLTGEKTNRFYHLH
ncbi:MAG: hypothetical protein ABSF48_04415 [Thermodesulfobacteriota bacterium]